MGTYFVSVASMAPLMVLKIRFSAALFLETSGNSCGIKFTDLMSALIISGDFNVSSSTNVGQHSVKLSVRLGEPGCSCSDCEVRALGCICRHILAVIKFVQHERAFPVTQWEVAAKALSVEVAALFLRTKIIWFLTRGGLMAHETVV